MKTLLVIFAVLMLAPVGRSQSFNPSLRMDLDEVIKPNNVFQDPTEGVTFVYPKGWSVRGGDHGSSDDETESAVYFDAPRRSRAYTTVYYQLYSQSASAPPATIPLEKFTRMVAAEKALNRLTRGLKDYKNLPESFVFAREGKRAVLKNLATFSKDGKPHAEYFIRIFGPVGYVIFNVIGPAPDVRAAMPDVDRMASTVKGALIDAEGAYAESIEWFLPGN